MRWQRTTKYNTTFNGKFTQETQDFPLELFILFTDEISKTK